MTQLHLRPTHPGEIDAVIAIETHPEVSKWVGQWSASDHFAGIHNDAIDHLVVLDEEDVVIGYGIIADKFNIDDNVELLRLALSRRGEGIGHALVETLLAHAFSIGNTHRVWLDVVAKNFAAVAVYVRAGFQREGTMRQAYNDETGRSDMYLMSILRPEWEDRSKSD